MIPVRQRGCRSGQDGGDSWFPRVAAQGLFEIGRQQRSAASPSRSLVQGSGQLGKAVADQQPEPKGGCRSRSHEVEIPPVGNQVFAVSPGDGAQGRQRIESNVLSVLETVVFPVAREPAGIGKQGSGEKQVVTPLEKIGKRLRGSGRCSATSNAVTRSTAAHRPAAIRRNGQKDSRSKDPSARHRCRNPAASGR